MVDRMGVVRPKVAISTKIGPIISGKQMSIVIPQAVLGTKTVIILSGNINMFTIITTAVTPQW